VAAKLIDVYRQVIRPRETRAVDTVSADLSTAPK
jgi:hypothetical protein